jgi:hypothetical protein
MRCFVFTDRHIVSIMSVAVLAWSLFDHLRMAGGGLGSMPP